MLNLTSALCSVIEEKMSNRQNIKLYKMKHFTPKKNEIFQLFPGGENAENVETWQLSKLSLGLAEEIKRTGVTLCPEPAGLDS